MDQTVKKTLFKRPKEYFDQFFNFVNYQLCYKEENKNG